MTGLQQFFDSKGTEIQDGDILLSGLQHAPVRYKFYLTKGGYPQVEMLGEITGIYSFEYFKTLRPNFVKE